MKKTLLRTVRALKSRHGDERGTVAILTAISLPVLMLFVGGGMDYARALDARARLQSAVDAALLATASHRMTHPDLTDAQLEAYFRKLMRDAATRRLAKKLNLDLSTLSFSRDGDRLQAHISGTMQTTFLKLIGMGSMNIGVQAETKAGFAGLEVALVLDTTGSMGWKGANGMTKIQELKKAAKDFVDTLAKRFGNADPDMFKVAIVPFSQYVNVGTGYANADWLDYKPKAKKARKKLKKKGIYWEGCVGSRQTPWNTRDGSYTLHKIPIVMNFPRNTNYGADRVKGYRRAYQYYSDGHDLYYNFCPSPILPLTSAISDKARIEAAIDGLKASGWTYIPAGLMWGWRVLSPGAPFTEGADDETVKTRNIRKIIILMTDGANTRAPIQQYGWAWKDHQEGNRTRADNFTRQACNAIKATNPYTGRPYAEIITVTFDVTDAGIKSLMQQCASIGSYDAKVGELQKLFRQIAEQVSELYLSG